MPNSPSTHFAPADRSASEDLERQVAIFSDGNFTRHLLDVIPSILLILNQNRQIIYGNRTLLDLIGAEKENFELGLRPGEVLHCVNAGREPGGCGTAEPCTACGMMAAILASLAGSRETRECRLLRHHNGRTEALDLLVWATPLEFQGETYSVFALSDISHEKRRRALERIFFHDVMNVVGSIKGFAELLHDHEPVDRRQIYAMIQEAADQTLDEIEAQRTLAAAESKELTVRCEALSLPMFLPPMLDFYRHHEVGRQRQIALAGAIPELVLVTDRTLLARILGNMLKNALEAAHPGETITVNCLKRDGGIEFSVHNRVIIPPEVQFEIFQRSFSTKGYGRGLGTYSMKVLSEYLDGEVDFTSSEKTGTVFRLRLPFNPA
jgi:signal transduction histidine kinase